ncbi:MAG: tRNA (adenosine(37)-N6)-threonylcarbamoyltransferase complex dimerization subunit type 1 TsaB [Bacteroidetes bacterium]|nr:MAG: tRNA (adenosine(37)-N6)-threonylcarbamoyltransferase complex dimerization subunit type 1 TsaB [Bacteroidota bacterium]
MALLLHLETSTDVCSVALSRGEEVLAQVEERGRNAHSRVLTHLVDRCVRAGGVGLKDLRAVSVSRGPGSFTSLRVGAAVAKGLCYALDLPLIGVDTLKALALEAACRHPPHQPTRYVPMIDARRMEVYCQLFDEQNNSLGPAEAKILEEDSFDPWLVQGYRLVFCGNGAPKAQTLLQKPGTLFLDLLPHAVQLVPLAWHAFQQGAYEDLAHFSPFYLKPPNITRPRQKPV